MAKLGPDNNFTAYICMALVRLWAHIIFKDLIFGPVL